MGCVWALLAFWLALSASLAQAAPLLVLSEILDRMARAQESVQGFSCDFVERLQRGSLPEEKLHGRIYAKAPQYLRVDQEGAGKRRVISDGRTVSVYMPAQNQILTGDWQAWLKATGFPVDALNFVGNVSPARWRSRYQVFLEGSEPHRYRLRFRPVDAREHPLTVWISDESFLPVRIELQDAQMTADVKLKDLKVNVPLSGRLFTIHAPPGTATVPLTF
jgi:outer membrane lipoprotein-sorting protein